MSSSSSLLVGYPTDSPPATHSSFRIAGFHSCPTTTPPADTPPPLTYDGTAHLMTVAPTGSGKGRSVVIPTLLTYPGSVVVLDPKGENYHITARARREMGQQVIRLDPFGVVDGHTDAFNLMDVFSLPNIDVETESQLMADLFSAGNRGSRDPFWDVNACMLLAGIISYVATIKEPAERTLGAVRDVLFSDDIVYGLAVILDTVGKQIPKAAYQQIAAFLSMPDRETRPCVQATANTYVAPLLSKDVMRATGVSSFSLNDFREGQPMTIYLIIPPDKLLSHRALLKLWIGVLLKTITSRTVIPDQQTLFLIDEAGQLGHFSYLYSIITLCRGYGLKCWTIWQDFQQLESNYPLDWQTLMNNCGVVQFFGGKNYQIARRVEELTGVPAHVVRQLPDDQQVLMTDGHAQLSRKIDYLTDPLFADRFDPNPFYNRPPRPLNPPPIEPTRG